MIHNPYQRLKAEMKFHSITYKELAEHLGITVTSLSNKINGKSDFLLGEAKKVMEYLEMDYNIFLS